MYQTPLHVAAARNAVHCAKLLLPRVVNVNVLDRSRHTALHYAVNGGYNEVSSSSSFLRLSLGPLVANWLLVSRALRPTAYCMHHRFAQMCRLLLANGASVTVFDNRKRRALHLAAYHGHLEILKMLIESGADVNARDQEVRHYRRSCVPFQSSSCCALPASVSASAEHESRARRRGSRRCTRPLRPTTRRS